MNNSRLATAINNAINDCKDYGNGRIHSYKEINVTELETQYPVAAAYIRAEGYEMASNYSKSAAGRKAKEEIASGNDYKTAIIKMETEWKATVTENMWN